MLVNAPAAVTLITAQTIENSPATNTGDLLRSVPGINVTQTSARDVNLTTRGATSTLATSQLALVDGRSIYLDVNAKAQAQAIALGGKITYVEADEAKLRMSDTGEYARAWDLWKRKVTPLK